MAGPCTNECNCFVDGTRGIVVDGVGDAGDPYNVHPDAARHLGLTVSSAALLPSLPDSEIGTQAFAEDTGLVHHYSGGGLWRVNVVDWAKAEDDPLTFSASHQLSSGFVLAGAAGWMIWAKGYVDAAVDAGSIIQFSMNLRLTDVPFNIDETNVITDNADATGGRPFNLPFSLMNVITLGDGATNDIQVEYFFTTLVGADPFPSTIKNLRIVALRVDVGDLTLAI